MNPDKNKEWEKRIDMQLKLLIENIVNYENGESIDMKVPLVNGLKIIVAEIISLTEARKDKEFVEILKRIQNDDLPPGFMETLIQKYIPK